MADASERLLKLRPVTFRYKKPDAEGNRPIQFGLVAEEVAEVLPELVVYNKDGQPDAVMYKTPRPMLLNELQQQKKRLDVQAAQLGELKQQVADVQELRQQVAALQQLVRTIQTASVNPQVNGSLVAAR